MSIHVFSGKNSKNIKKMDEQCVGDNRPQLCPRRDFCMPRVTFLSGTFSPFLDLRIK
jgi:hypothetical protein